MPPLMDRTFAEFHLKNMSATDSHHYFLAFLFAASRSGYLCVEIQDDKILPDPNEIWEEEVDLPRLVDGACSFPSVPVVIRENKRYYLQRLYTAKKQCEDEWIRLQNAPLFNAIDESQLAFQIEIYKAEMTQEQLQAILLASSSQILILTGGPGTGKTFTAGRILSALSNCLPEAYNSDHIAIAAPTGKAALNLQASLRKNLGESPQLASLKSKTLHALLGVRSEQPMDEIPYLPYSLILVDEASMIDVELMAILLRSIKSGAKLILIGDPYQLPPVEGPAIFPDLALRHSATVMLTRCLRAEMQELVQLAEQVKATGKLPAHVKRLDNHPLDALIDQHLSFFPRHFPQKTSSEAMLAAFQRFCILTPLRKGPLGSEALNRAILQRLQNVQAIPIMITANDYRFNLFNGEIGILITQQKKFQGQFNKEDYVHFSGGRSLPALLLPRFELAYAMTVHKSQGSEFDELLLLLPNENITKPLLYTAVTRARRSVSVWMAPVAN